MAALAIAGKVLLWLLLLLLVLLVVVLFLPVAVWLDYKEQIFSVRLSVLGIKVTLWPQKPLTEEQKRKKEERAATKKAKKAQKKPADQPEGQAKRNKGHKAKITLDVICGIASAAGRLLRGVFGALRVCSVRLYLPVSGKDAADTAVQYGKMQAYLGTTLGFLNRFFWLDIKEMHLEPDFTGSLKGSERFSCCIRARLYAMGTSAVVFVYTLFKEKLIDVFI